MILRLLKSALPMLLVFIIDNLVFYPSGFYLRWDWFDVFMHILGGFVAGWSAVRFLHTEKELIVKPKWIYWLLILGMVALIGVAWEVYEFYLQKITGFITQPSIADTVADLVNDVVGALLFCLFFSGNYYQAIKISKIRKN